MSSDRPLPSAEPSRRDLAKLLGLAAAVPLLPALAAAAEPQPPADPLAASADALVEVVKARYGKHLTEEQLKAARPSILRGLASAERLKKPALANADEPDFVFSPDVPG